MDGPALSRRELQILGQIEAGLRADDELDRELTTMRLSRLRGLRRLFRGRPHAVLGALAVLFVLSSALLVTAVAFDLPLLIAAVTALWGAGLVVTLALVRRRARAKARARARARRRREPPR